ncbi:MAG TPA: S8 family serine peptidase [candidate division Zixibacteria bacterium]|nr:S8 family serine peptidase [candidate division Zixibacteria bacterium]
MNRIALSCLTLVIAAFLLAPMVSAEKIKIEKLDDLPRHTYTVSEKAADLIVDDTALMTLAHALKTDLEDDLLKYDISDKTTLKGYYGILASIAMLDKDYDKAAEFYNKSRELEDKESTRLTAGLLSQSYIVAARSGSDGFNTALAQEYTRRVNELPYDVVQADIESSKAQAEMISKNFIVGLIDSRLQPILDKSGGELSKDLAAQLVRFGYTLRYYLPYQEMVKTVLTAYLDSHKTEKADIWADRDVILTEGEGKSPVIICIWDSGTDTTVYADQLWTNTAEIPDNGIDDDNNGFIDDVHGIAYTLYSDKTTDLLYPIGDVESERPRLQRLMKGVFDMQYNIDSDESREIKETLSTLKPEEVQPFIEDISKYGNLCHGTHVAGIALAGNPYARLLTSRLTFDYRMIGDVPTVKQARKDSVATVETIQYYKDNGVRVVNMSWGGDLAGIESALEEHNAGGTPEERKALAREIFEIGKGALYESIKDAPEILFITSAGNENNDVKFDESLPSGLDLPNILSVGAVDQAGDETSFTSFGKVDVYANGFEVPSFVPGGDQLSLSGTSQASPQVTGLAAKLLAVRSDLTVAQLRKLILDGADHEQAGDREVVLMNPKKSFELLQQM